MEIPVYQHCSIVCVWVCVCGFPTKGDGLSSYVTLVSCFHGCCDIRLPVERITLRLCNCV